MFRILPSRDESTIAIQVEGKATKEDAMKLNEHVEKEFGEDTPFNILAIIDDVDGTTFKGMTKGMKFDTKRWDQFEKFAIVSEKSWTGVATKVVTFLPGVVAKNFTKDEIEQAWEWVGSGNI